MASDPVRLRDLASFVDRKIKSLINNDLKEICRQEGLQVSGVKAALQKRISEGNSISRVQPTLFIHGANNSSVSHSPSPPQGRRSSTRTITLSCREPRSRSSTTKSSAFTGPRHHHSHFSCSRRHARLLKTLQRDALIPSGSAGARHLYTSCLGQIQRESFLSSQRSPHSYEGVIRYLLDSSSACPTTMRD